MYEQEILAYRYACSTFLSGCSLQNLRAYARKIGVDHPTEKKKKPLIDEIVQFLSVRNIKMFRFMKKTALPCSRTPRIALYVKTNKGFLWNFSNLIPSLSS